MNADWNRIQALRATELFGDQAESSLRDLLRQFDEVRVRAGERLAVEGQPCHEFVVVLEGRLGTCSRGVAGELGPGSHVGWTAMRERGTSDETVVALTDARLLVMSHAQFRAAVPPPQPTRRLWALPTSRRSLPRRQHLRRA